MDDQIVQLQEVVLHTILVSDLMQPRYDIGTTNSTFMRYHGYIDQLRDPDIY